MATWEEKQNNQIHIKSTILAIDYTLGIIEEISPAEYTAEVTRYGQIKNNDKYIFSSVKEATKAIVSTFEKEYFRR